MKQPEAMRLADDLIDLWDSGFFEREDVEQAAAELRRLNNEVTDLKQALDIAGAVFKERDRLHEANQAMLEALKEIVDASDGGGWSQLDASFSKARAAIAKGEAK